MFFGASEALKADERQDVPCCHGILHSGVVVESLVFNQEFQKGCVSFSTDPKVNHVSDNGSPSGGIPTWNCWNMVRRQHSRVFFACGVFPDMGASAVAFILLHHVGTEIMPFSGKIALSPELVELPRAGGISHLGHTHSGDSVPAYCGTVVAKGTLSKHECRLSNY